MAENSPESGNPEQIERDIEQAREDLGRTVDEIATRLDVKHQAQQRIGAARDQAKAHPGAVAAVGGAAVASGVALLMAARRRRR